MSHDVNNFPHMCVNVLNWNNTYGPRVNVMEYFYSSELSLVAFASIIYFNTQQLKAFTTSRTRLAFTTSGTRLAFTTSKTRLATPVT